MEIITNNWKVIAACVTTFVGGFAVGTQFPTEGAAKKKLSPKAAKAASPAPAAPTTAANS
jgi:hypothetical protein